MGEALPLAVDLDGTVILSDMTKISARKIIFRRPWYLFLIPFFELTKGRPYWKKRVANLVSVDPSDLIYHEAFMNWLKQEKESGREMILATASHIVQALPIAEHVGLFDDVMGSEGRLNLGGRYKAKALVERYGKGKFAYCGNSKADLEVWPDAGEIIVVNPSRGVLSGLHRDPDILFE